jgi:mannose-1-phosphate guanylyltransferase
VLTADHFIANEEKFLQLLTAAYQVAKDNYLVTLGIEPTSPATGYGYIHQGEKIGLYNQLNAYQVIKFKEKPDRDQALAMIASGDHAWNSGMFVWKVENIMDEFAWQMPDLHERLARISKAWKTSDSIAVIDQEWPEIIPETIDYGIMEGAHKVAVIPAEGLGWNDVGSWDSLFDVFKSDQDGNIVRGGLHMGLDTTGTLVYQNQEQRLIVTIGVDDLVVVDTEDVLLVCKKEDAQDVRQIVNQLRASGNKFI